jgi:glycine oxidase
VAKLKQVVVVGCGVIGATIAYQLSQSPELQVTVLEAKPKGGQGATGAALGVLMAACGQKAKGTLVRLRLASLRLYEDLIPNLIAQTGIDIPFNRSGILSLSHFPDIEAKWRSLIDWRRKQGVELQLLDADDLRSQYPELALHDSFPFALYSPSDRALNPTRLVQALVSAAEINGAKFIYNQAIANLNDLPADSWAILTTGMSTNALFAENILQPVGGQAIAIKAPNLNLAQVINAEDIDGDDINIVPLGNDEYWVGATVEFEDAILPRTSNTDLLMEKLIKFCPAFAKAEVLNTWAGYRPRPVSQQSPILGFLPQRDRTLIATGHYRNGVLMAPITAQITCDLLLKGESSLPWQAFALKPA